jgi:phosphoribosyl-AMP cyclohydrolase
MVWCCVGSNGPAKGCWTVGEVTGHVQSRMHAMGGDCGGDMNVFIVIPYNGWVHDDPFATDVLGVVVI